MAVNLPARIVKLQPWKSLGFWLIVGIVICFLGMMCSFPTEEGVKRDAWVCQINGGVPIYSRDRTQMTDCKMPMVVR